jgi:tetratricopeptide (TPR) repeat protein
LNQAATILKLLCLIAAIFPGGLLAEEDRISPDIVTVAGGKRADARRLKGRILDYTGRGLQLELLSGLEKVIPAEDILQIETNRTPQQRAARLAVKAGQIEKALRNYHRLLDTDVEERPWVRREILAELIECQRGLGLYDQAANNFIRLLEQDPNTPYLDAIPLLWAGGAQITPKTSKHAEARLASRVPLVRLLGASFLLTSSHRERAAQVLMQLRENPDTIISSLATAQWLRTRVLKASQQDIRLCQQAIADLPAQLRSGPYYVLGQLYASRDEHRQAAIAMMHVPILYADQPRLAAESLLTAAKSMVKSGLVADAIRSYDELLTNYPKTTAAAEAKQRRRELIHQVEDF